MKQYVITALVDGAMVVGLVLPMGHVVTIDVEDERAKSFQSLVDVGVISVAGMNATASKGKGK